MKMIFKKNACDDLDFLDVTMTSGVVSRFSPTHGYFRLRTGISDCHSDISQFMVYSPPKRK